MNDIVEKNGEKVMFAGCCPFCGQYVQVEIEAPWTEEELMDASAMACECSEAERYRRRKVRKEKASRKINELFQEDSQEIIPIMNVGAELVLMDVLEKISISTAAGVNAKISTNSKGSLKIERSVTIKRSNEI